MEKIILTVGGLLKLITLSDIFFFITVLFLILFLVYIVYLLRIDENTSNISGEKATTKNIFPKKDKAKSTSDELIDIVDNLQKNYDPEPIDLTRYEKEQESTAIISYQELLAKTKNDNNINYEDDYDSGFSDLEVQKVTDESNTKEYVNLPKAVMLKYESEETFLKALKTLQKNLVR